MASSRNKTAASVSLAGQPALRALITCNIVCCYRMMAIRDRLRLKCPTLLCLFVLGERERGGLAFAKKTETSRISLLVPWHMGDHNLQIQ